MDEEKQEIVKQKSHEQIIDDVKSKLKNMLYKDS